MCLRLYHLHGNPRGSSRFLTSASTNPDIVTIGEQTGGQITLCIFSSVTVLLKQINKQFSVGCFLYFTLQFFLLFNFPFGVDKLSRQQIIEKEKSFTFLMNNVSFFCEFTHLYPKVQGKQLQKQKTKQNKRHCCSLIENQPFYFIVFIYKTGTAYVAYFCVMCT